MNSSDIVESKKKVGIKDLIASLGLDICPVAYDRAASPSDRFLILRDYSTQQLAVMHDQHGSFYFSFSGFYKLLDDLLKSIYYITFDSTGTVAERYDLQQAISHAPVLGFKNPYLGCGSLTEALIKKDLLGIDVHQPLSSFQRRDIFSKT